MADEILGNCYELITEIALADFSKVLKTGEKIFAQETPVGIGIVPDIIIGKDIQKPRLLLQVHHTRAERASEKKFWRNVGEYVDARNTLGGKTLIVTIAFDSGQKRKLSAAATHLMDGFLEVDREPFGKELLDFAKDLEDEIERRNTKLDERLKLVRKRLKARPATVKAIRAFAVQLNTTLSTASKAGASWFATYSKIQATRSAPRIPDRKLTTLRRALGRLLPVDDETLLRKLLKSVRTDGKAPWPQYFVDVGIATKTIGGAKFTNPCPPGTTVSRKMESDPAYEVFRMTEVFDDDTIVGLWNMLRSVTGNLAQACAAIRSASEFSLYHKFVVTNYAKLATPAGMAKALQDCFTNPDTILGRKIGLENAKEKSVWILEYVMTLIKAHTGRQQGYGYTRLDDESGTGLGTGIGPHLSDFVSRARPLRKDLLTAFATTLADRLARITKRWVNLNEKLVSEFYLKARFEDGIYKSSKFDPAVTLIAPALPTAKRETRTSTFLTSFVGKGATTSDAILHKDALVMWQSASAQGDDHKTKELCGRIGMLRVTTDKSGKVVSAPFAKAVLVIDGTWKQEQMERLATAGFDAIYYVDEIDQLVKDLGLGAKKKAKATTKRSTKKKN